MRAWPDAGQAPYQALALVQLVERQPGRASMVPERAGPGPPPGVFGRTTPGPPIRPPSVAPELTQ